jgi:hypothetical protein
MGVGPPLKIGLGVLMATLLVWMAWADLLNVKIEMAYLRRGQILNG